MRLGAPLLDRTPHGIEPTLYGRALIKRGLAIFDELRHSVEDIESLLDPSIGTARIGCTEPLAAGLVPHVIEGLNRRHPRVSFLVAEGQQFGTLQRELRDRNIELMIGRAPGPVSDEDMASEVLFDDRLLVVAGSANKWTSLADLRDEPWVFPTPGSIGATLVNEAFLSAGLSRRTGLLPPRLDSTFMCSPPGDIFQFCQNRQCVLPRSTFLSRYCRSICGCAHGLS